MTISEEIAKMRAYPFSALLLATLLVGCGTNPVTGKREIQFVSEAAELRIGAENYAPMRQSEGGDFKIDPELTTYISEVGQKLAAVSDRKLPYEFVVLNSSVPNAWALPGGKVALNRGLLTELHSESELAAVLGHEITHAAARHGAKAQERGTFLQVGMVAAQIGLAANDTNGTLANLALQGTGLGAQLVQMKYGRDQENEADHYGMVYMKRAGYDLHGAVTLQETFVRLASETGKNQGWLEGLFASHPPSVERVALNKLTLTELTAAPGTASSNAPGAAAGVAGDVGIERFMARTAQLRTLKPAYDKHDAAVAAANKKDFVAARKLAAEASKLLPREGRFPQLQGDIEMAEKKPKEALPYYEKAIALSSDYFGSFLGGGIAKYKLGDKAGAREWLTKSSELLPTAPAAYYLGHLANEGGDRIKALEYLKAAAGVNGEIGKLAADEYLTLDLPQNPGNYVATGAQLDSNGHAFVTVQNRANVAIEGIEITPLMVDQFGQIAQQGQRHMLPLALQPGESATVDAGIGNLSAAQAAQLRFRVDAARAAAAPTSTGN